MFKGNARQPRSAKDSIDHGVGAVENLPGHDAVFKTWPGKVHSQAAVLGGLLDWFYASIKMDMAAGCS